ncbi:MAG TPA: CbiX/SirB N-terminal domain-containing protein [Thermoanaerobaculia bacterium]|nr:CbiX/SirB N-terminal domain-containing protein [Thermoanaerobaculia bacterium]
MKVLLLLAHGSPRPEASADVFAAAEAVRARGRFDAVEVGFLECNHPDVPAAIERCAALGAGEIIAVPFFLLGGRHLTHDLPELLEQAERRHPSIRIRMADSVGRERTLGRIAGERAAEALARSAGGSKRDPTKQ